MLHYLLRRNGPTHRWGATRAQADLNGLLLPLRSPADPPSILLDYSGIETVNGSYLRATALWVLRCGLKARGKDALEEIQGRADAWAIRPQPLKAFYVTNLSEEVRNDLEIQLRDNRMACLEALTWTKESVLTVRVLGQLDEQLRRALECLQNMGGAAVAEELWSKFQEDRVGLTAWNNRLAELFLRHVVNRTKEGKFWRYFTPFKEALYGNPLSTCQS